ncbi:MAG: MFS transporter [Oceanobacter sp.]|nr:MAG: MFS transporter [Oceanobacter sp.]
MTAEKKSLNTYENRLIGVLSLTFGVVFFDRQAMNFLAPFVQDDLGLSNTQIGILASALALTWAFSGVFFGRLCDRFGRQRLVLITAVIVFSLSSVLSGLATSFLFLLAARMLMGLAEGPVLPISQTVVALESSPERRGVNMGFMQQFGSNILGTFLAPLVLVALATQLGWREAFYIAGIPGLICALLIWLYMRDPDPKRFSAANSEVDEKGGVTIAEGLRYRNIWLCIMLSGLSIGWAILCFVFLPLYFINVAGFSPTKMSILMSLLGLSALIAGVGVPWLSDRYGRKRIILIVTIMALLVPLGIMAAGNSLLLLIPCLLIGFAATGATPLVVATIPAETLPGTRVAAIIGLVLGSAEIIAGLIGPLLGGIIADAFGLIGTLWLQVGFIIAMLVLASLLRETAPSKTGQLAVAQT